MEQKIEPRMIAKLSEVRGLSELIAADDKAQQARRARAVELIETIKAAKEQLDVLQEEKRESHAALWGSIDSLLMSAGLINEFEKENGSMVYSIANDQILLIGERESDNEDRLSDLKDKLSQLASKVKGVSIEVEEVKPTTH